MIFIKISLKNLGSNYTRILQVILNKSWRQHPTKQQLYGHLPPITKMIQVRQTRHVGHCWRSRDELISRPLHMDEQKQDDQLKSIYNSSVPIQDVALKTYWKWWTIEMGGERASGRSMLMVRYDDEYQENSINTIHDKFISPAGQLDHQILILNRN